MRLGTDFRGISPQSYQANLHTINRQRSIAQDDVGTLANDNQVQAQFATGPMKHTLLAGVDYQYADASRLLGSATVGTPPIDYLNPVYFQAMSIPPIQTDAHQINDQTGLYVQDQIKIGNLVGIFGVRHDRAGSISSRSRSPPRPSSTFRRPMRQTPGRPACSITSTPGFLPM